MLVLEKASELHNMWNFAMLNAKNYINEQHFFFQSKRLTFRLFFFGNVLLPSKLLAGGSKNLTSWSKKAEVTHHGQREL